MCSCQGDWPTFNLSVWPNICLLWYIHTLLLIHDLYKHVLWFIKPPRLSALCDPVCDSARVSRTGAGSVRCLCSGGIVVPHCVGKSLDNQLFSLSKTLRNHLRPTQQEIPPCFVNEFRFFGTGCLSSPDEVAAGQTQKYVKCAKISWWFYAPNCRSLMIRVHFYCLLKCQGRRFFLSPASVFVVELKYSSEFNYSLEYWI